MIGGLCMILLLFVIHACVSMSTTALCTVLLHIHHCCSTTCHWIEPTAIRCTYNQCSCTIDTRVYQHVGLLSWSAVLWEYALLLAGMAAKPSWGMPKAGIHVTRIENPMPVERRRGADVTRSMWFACSSKSVYYFFHAFMVVIAVCRALWCCLDV